MTDANLQKVNVMQENNSILCNNYFWVGSRECRRQPRVYSTSKKAIWLAKPITTIASRVVVRPL